MSKIRGTPSHIAEKYLQLARDAQTLRRSGGGGELLPARRALFPPDRRRAGAVPPDQSPILPRRRTRRATTVSTTATTARRECPDRARCHSAPASRNPTCRASRNPIRRASNKSISRASNASPREHREQQNYAPRPQPQPQPPPEAVGDVDRLPSFITGGQPPQPQPSQPGFGQNGHENQGDRFPLHRRRRRHRGPRHEIQGAAHSGGGDGDDNSRGNE